MPRLTWFASICLCLWATALAGAQTPAPPPAATSSYVPIQPSERLSWVVEGEVGRRTLAVGLLTSGSKTVINSPDEWGRAWGGLGKRFLQREADVAISNTIEASLGAVWGEDPRYLPSNRHGAWPRISYALKTVFLAPRRDGHLAPAWGRVASNVFNNVIENTWLPPSMTTPGPTTVRSVNGFVGRMAGNLWDEFEPDLLRWLGR